MHASPRCKGRRVTSLHVVQHVYGCTFSHRIFSKCVRFIYGRTKFSVYQLIYMSLYNIMRYIYQKT